MSNFADPIIGGDGALVYPSIHSPDYEAGVSGWTIDKDGSAEFNNLTVRGTFAGTNYVINSSGAFFYSATPANGNLLISIASAAGTDPYANAYPQGLNVKAGVIAGSVFEGTNWLENDAGQFMYTGAPAAGNMLISIAPQSGTDAHGNAYQAGVTVWNGPDAYLIVNVNVGADAPAIGMATGVSFEHDIAAIYTFPVGSGATEYLATRIQSPSSTLDEVLTAIEMYSNYASAGGGLPQGQLFCGSVVGASWDQEGFHAPPPAWTAPSLASGWVNQGGSDVLFKYRLTPVTNQVEIIGVVNGASATSSTFFTLPAGYRPASQQAACTATSTGWAAGFVQVGTNGAMSVQASNYKAVWVFHGFISLDA